MVKRNIDGLLPDVEAECMHTYPKCASKREQSDACNDPAEREHTQPEGEMEDTGEKEFWT